MAIEPQTGPGGLPENINVASKENEMNLITCDGDLESNNEHDIYRLLLGEIITAASIQKKGGNLVV